MSLIHMPLFSYMFFSVSAHLALELHSLWGGLLFESFSLGCENVCLSATFCFLGIPGYEEYVCSESDCVTDSSPLYGLDCEMVRICHICTSVLFKHLFLSLLYFSMTMCQYETGGHVQR